MSEPKREQSLTDQSDKRLTAIFVRIKKNCAYTEKHLGFPVDVPIDCKIPLFPEALDFKLLNQ